VVLEEALIKGHYFWIAGAIFLGLNNIEKYNNFAELTVVSPLKEIVIIGKILTLFFVVYFLYSSSSIAE